MMDEKKVCFVCGKIRDEEEEFIKRKIDKDSTLYLEILEHVLDFNLEFKSFCKICDRLATEFEEVSKEKKSLRLEIEFRLSNKDNEDYDDFDDDDTLGIDEDFVENNSNGEDQGDNGNSEVENVSKFIKSNVNIYDVAVDQPKPAEGKKFPIVQKKKEVVITKFETKSSISTHNDLPLHYFKIPNADTRTNPTESKINERTQKPEDVGQKENAELDESASCEKCGKVFQCKARLGIHHNHCMSKLSSDLKCSKCLKTFANRRNLRDHMKAMHEYQSDKVLDTPKFNCQHCGKIFSKKFNYTSHLLRHSNEAAFQCDFEGCGKSFKRERTLHKHQLVFHEGRRERYLCGQCGQVFSSQSGFRTHVANHVGKDYIKRNVKCHVCDKLFRCHSDMKTHMVVHSKERPFVCSWPDCDQAFSQKASLKDHINVHEKKYQCQLCEKAFGRERYLRMHSKTCTGRDKSKGKAEDTDVPHIIVAMEGVQVIQDTEDVAVMLVHSQEVEVGNVIQVVTQEHL